MRHAAALGLGKVIVFTTTCNLHSQRIMQRIGIKSGRKSTIRPFPQALPCKVAYFTKSIYNPIPVFSIRTPLPPLFLIRCGGKRFSIPGGTGRLFSFRHSLPFAPSSQTERHPRK